MPAGSSRMKLFKSHEPNTFHYVTAVCFKRTPVFRSERACELFVEALAETRRRNPFKLIGYVLMPDHAHLIMNPLSRDIGLLMGRIKSTSARSILDWLRESSHLSSLKKLALDIPQKKGHTHAIWLKDFSSIDLWSPRFIRQKLNYIHLNPVRAGLCKHPAEWKWSSYRAYLPHEPGSVPIEMDWRGYWRDEEFGSFVETAGNARL
ncbi:MAG: REP-associated tyrosine transposase [Blastocatellia bacterium]|nr:REP-associated tyrosine transposase [Blastocatellia bacterium]